MEAKGECWGPHSVTFLIPLRQGLTLWSKDDSQLALPILPIALGSQAYLWTHLSLSVSVEDWNSGPVCASIALTHPLSHLQAFFFFFK